MWSIQASADIPAAPDSVWAHYTDPDSWSRWAHNTRGARFEEPLRPGSVLTVTPARGPAQRITVVELVTDRRLVTRARPPGADMTFRYAIEPTPAGCRVRHEISMEGPLAWLYGLLIRRRNRRQLGEEVQRLAAIVAGDAGGTAGGP